MIHEEEDFAVYTNADGTKETLVAVDNTHKLPCRGCVGFKCGAVCLKLPVCSDGITCVVWKEVAQ